MDTLEEILIDFASFFKFDPESVRANQLNKELNEAKSKLTKLIQEEKKEQSTLTSRWIEKHIARLAKDPNFKNETASVAFTYAQDQARQGRTKALKQE